VSGTVVTVTDDEAELAAEVPFAFVAVAVIVVDTPLPNPVIVKGDDPPDAE